MASRIISFDILRGWAILGNLVIHTFMLVSQVEGIAESTPELLDTSGYIMMGLVVVFGHWRGLFLLISACVHMLIMNMKLRRGIKREVILVQELFKGLLLWLWAMFFYVFLAQWQLSKEWVETGTSSIEWQNIYHADQFANIAWAIMISAVLFYFLTSNEKTKKPLVMSIVFAIIGCLFIFPAPATYEAANVFWGVDLHSGQSLTKIGDKGWWDYILRMLGNQMLATESPLMPHFGYSAVGSILGIYLSQEKKPKKEKFLLWGYGLAGASIVFGVIWLFGVEKIPSDPFQLVIFHAHPTWFVFVTIGMLMFLVIGLMHRHEYNEGVNWEKRLKWSRFSRRVGFLSLSVYSFASLQAVLRVILHFIFPNQGFRTMWGLSTGMTFLLIGIEISVWFGIMWLWEKWNFNLSLEWLFALILKRPSQRKLKDKPKLFGDFLDVKGRVINVTPEHWVEKTTEMSANKIEK
ncbi:MAG: hypothetical protein H7644_04660 [Candidatus Heimdallarchaeota archaeon]|nr:hypothetical protein [Candidatus Heimdallarchaeota archaeon]MCK5143035.1 hypothetical protein [Candidatus Heimdallarchaeota archaeon]